MVTRRSFLGSVLGGAAVAAGVEPAGLRAAGRLAWPGPIGLELYTVRQLFAKDPAGTLKQVAATGYREVEITFSVKPDVLNPALQAAGLTAPSAYTEVPKSVDDWKTSVDTGKGYGVRYLVVGDNPRLDAEGWKRRADLFNRCGELCLNAGIQFCYHAHFHELEPTEGTTGYDLMLTRCDAKLLKMEMDIFWVTYAGTDPLHYWRLYPGRFPLLHIKDLYRNVTVNPYEKPSGPNPFAPVGQGRIDWSRIFSHVGEAGAKHIYVEQDECNMPPLEAIKISFNYLKNLQIG